MKEDLVSFCNVSGKSFAQKILCVSLLSDLSVFSELFKTKYNTGEKLEKCD